ncbi:MAG TPA: energy transducer TonB [Bacteroidota bacterium]
MILEKFKYAFLGRMRRAEGLPPKIVRNYAVQLGAKPSIIFELSLIASLVLAIAGFTLFPTVETKRQPPVIHQELVSVEDVEITRQQDRPPAPVRPPVVIEAPSDEVLDDVPLVSSEVNLAQDAPPPAPKQGDNSDEEFFVAVEEMPTLVGGITGLMKNVVYPELAVRAGVQGRVTVLAFVNEEGDVVKAQVLKGIGVGCDEAALSAIKKAKFVPGKQRGKPVKTRISIPVEFRLTQ